jgi:type IV pilus assembly protein PilE
LLELLIAMAIAALLSALASSAYGRFVDASRRADGRAALLALAAAQERHLLAHATYAERLVAPGSAPDPESADGSALPWPDVSLQQHYAVTIARGDVEGYRLEARPRGVQARDRGCVLLALEGTGRREARDESGADVTRRCWGG